MDVYLVASLGGMDLYSFVLSSGMDVYLVVFLGGMDLAFVLSSGMDVYLVASLGGMDLYFVLSSGMDVYLATETTSGGKTTGGSASGRPSCEGGSASGTNQHSLQPQISDGSEMMSARESAFIATLSHDGSEMMSARESAFIATSSLDGSEKMSARERRKTTEGTSFMRAKRT